MGDFLGFTFGGVHSSDLGITRVSGGDRYEEQLHPEIKDRTAEVPGVNGEYYFGSDFGPKSFDIEVAYDHLTEKQFRNLRRVFGTKEIKELIFDERPYKKYMAKLESPVELSYICFDERIRVKYSEEHSIGTIDTQEGAISGEVLEELPDGVRMIDDGQGNRIREKVDPWVYKEETERIYKGEGKMTFICYFPFAKSTFKVLPEAGQKYYEGSEEWAISSGILSNSIYNSNLIDNFQMYNNSAIVTYRRGGSFRVYNCGDFPTGFRLYLPFEGTFNNGQETVTQKITYRNLHVGYDFNNGSSEERLYEFICGSGEIKPKYDGQKGILIDTNNDLILGVKNFSFTLTGATYETDGTIFNEYISAGSLFKLPVNNDNDYLVSKIRWQGVHYFGEEEIEDFDPTNYSFDAYIFYDYLYF